MIKRKHNDLLENGVDESHIIEMAFDLCDNIEYRDAKIFYPWAKEQITDGEKYYFLLDEVQLLDNLFHETYISDIVKRNKIRNVGEMEALLDALSSAIGALTNPNKLKNTFKSVGKSKITATTITKYIEYLEDAFLIEEARRYDIKGRSYINTPLKYYIQSAYMIGTEEKRLQEIKPFLKINDSFKKIIITSDTPKPFYTNEGILMMC